MYLNSMVGFFWMPGWQFSTTTLLRFHLPLHLQPEGAPSAAETSIQGPHLSNGSQQASAEPAPKDELTRVRSLRESSELSNRKRNYYSDKSPNVQGGELTSWPVTPSPDDPMHTHHAAALAACLFGCITGRGGVGTVDVDGR